jgi:ketosteroid isomerase-like protein/uncharacterized protein YciI
MDPGAATRFVLIYQPGPSWSEGRPLSEQPLGPHRAYIEKLFEAGAVVLAGPFLDAASGGFAIVRATAPAAAARILADDPAISGGVLRGEVRPWHPLFESARGQRPLEAERNLEAVRRIFALVEERGDAGASAARWQSYEGAYDRDVAIHEAGSLPYGGDYTGTGAVARHAQAFIATWASLQSGEERALEPEFLADGDRVAVLWRQRAHIPRTGERFDMPAVSIYRMRDGRVVDSRMFHFDAGAVRDFLERAKRAADAPGGAST